MRIISNKDWGMVIKTPLERLDPAKVDAIALHHMAHPTAGIDEVQRWHLNQGWRAFGYHYWIGFDGAVYEGRGYEHVGAGVEGQNGHILSVGFQGNYQSGAGLAVSAMPAAQFDSGVHMIQYLRAKVAGITRVDGHRAFMPTACPGDTFPLSEMTAAAARGEAEQRAVFRDVAPDDYARGHIEKLRAYGIVNGDPDGNFKPDEAVSRRDAAIMIANALTVMGK